MPIYCPNCRSTSDHRVVLSARTIGAIVANVLWAALQIVIGIGFYDEWRLQRKCLRCGWRFQGPWKEPPNYDECVRCGYNLTGNISGRCPECGWKLARRFRMYRKAVQRQQERPG